MKAKEIKERSTAELQQAERDLRRELFQARFANFTSQLDDTAKLRRLRRSIARVKTALRQRAS